MRAAVVVVVVVLLLLVVIGWISFSTDENEASITIEGEKIQRDAGDIVDGAKNIAGDIRDNAKE